MKNFTMTTHCKKITKIQKHNDRNFESDAPHIDKEKTKDNLNWTWCGGVATNEEAEKLYYKMHYKEWMKKTNTKYAKSRHKEKISGYTDKLTSPRFAPTEMIFEIGNKDNKIDADTIKNIFFQYKEIMDDTFGGHFHILDYNLHMDEPNTSPHFHIRSIIDYVNENGHREIAQDKGLEAMGIQLKDPTKKKCQSNNRSQTFTAMQRQLLIDIAKDYDIQIVDSERPGGKDLKAFKEQQDQLERISKKKRQELDEEFERKSKENALKLRQEYEAKKTAQDKKISEKNAEISEKIQQTNERIRQANEAVKKARQEENSAILRKQKAEEDRQAAEKKKKEAEEQLSQILTDTQKEVEFYGYIQKVNKNMVEEVKKNAEKLQNSNVVWKNDMDYIEQLYADSKNIISEEERNR